MNIGIDVRLIGKNRTGDEVVIFNLVKNFAQLESEHNFRLFTDVTEKEGLDEIAKQLGIVGKNNFEIVSLPSKNKFSWNFWTLPRYLAKNPVDVFHTQYITPFFVSKKIKIVTIVHDISFNFFSQFIRLADLLFLKMLIPLSLKRADKIVGVSEFTRNEIIEYYKIVPEKVEWIHNAISEDFLNQDVSPEKLELVRKKYALPKKFVLYVGTLQPRKNLDQLVMAFGNVQKDLGDVDLVICGNRKGKNFDSRIDTAVQELGLGDKVFFPGFIDEEDKRAIFASAHVFAFPSLYEGFGIPPLEAMSQGVPVICSNISSLKEIATDGALYFEVSSLDDFSKKLYDICKDEDLRNKLISNGKKRISFFSWQKSAQKMLAIYEKLSHN
ncbi:MAG: mannosyltransferase B-like protein [uncultured bacterium]|nr:MAG: mannosyltransferase B-like protein [uncultured bacterium]